MNEALAHVVQVMRLRHVSERIIERVIRLNPDHRWGMRLRGVHYSSHRAVYMDCVSKGRVIREKGRDVWNKVPRWCIHKQGKREYISRNDYVDNIWCWDQQKLMVVTNNRKKAIVVHGYTVEPGHSVLIDRTRGEPSCESLPMQPQL